MRQLTRRLPPMLVRGGFHRCFSIHYNASDADVEDLIESSLDKTSRREIDSSPSRVLTTRREALSLYREIFRITSLFEWQDNHGKPWRDVLRESARQEFEAARHEKDPEIINRLLVVGRDAVHQVAEKFLQKRGEMVENKDIIPPPDGSIL